MLPHQCRLLGSDGITAYTSATANFFSQLLLYVRICRIAEVAL